MSEVCCKEPVSVPRAERNAIWNMGSVTPWLSFSDLYQETGPLNNIAALDIVEGQIRWMNCMNGMDLCLSICPWV